MIEFRERFALITGFQPYDWQVSLFKVLIAGNVPSNISLPTGAGKTLTILVWLLARAGNPSLPTRLVYVVDRRSVVDQSTRVVEQIRSAIEVRPSDFAYLSDGLGISTLRGEYADNQEWSAMPHRPSVIVGTVDMIGSRLLFSGYGDGAYGRSLHAGLLGNDSWVVFDECHLVPAFSTLLKSVEHIGGKLKPFHVTLMSATSGGDSGIEVSDEDLKNATFKQRFYAEKKLSIVHADAILKKIIAIAKTNPVARTIVFVKMPADAVNIAQQLQGFKTVLLTGTMRGKERDELVDNPAFQAFTKPEEPIEPHVLVATSAGEVGIDLTCSRMVTDAAFIPSLLQRFGRCNRFGESPEAHVHVVVSKKDWLDNEKDGYKEDLTFLTSLHGEVSCANLWAHREEIAEFAKSPAMATLTTSVVDKLSMTSLKHNIDVEDFLRGQKKEDRYVEVCFRTEASLLADMNDGDFEHYVKHFPVLSFERLSEKASRLRGLVESLLEAGKDATCAAIMVNGSHWGGRLSQLPKNLVNCTLILPPSCGLILQSGMLTLGDGRKDLDVSTIEHKHHPARKRLILPIDSDVDEITSDEKIVFDRPVDGMRIVIIKPKVSKSARKVLLTVHSQAVAELSREFATKLGLDVDVFEQAGLHHDVGKTNRIWQAAAGNKSKEPIAKGQVIPGRLRGFRHEFESMDAIDGELEKHVVAAHHGGARPTWIGDRELSPQHIDEGKVYEQIIRFSGLQQNYGWWGLAYLEAVLRAADAYVSEDE